MIFKSFTTNIYSRLPLTIYRNLLQIKVRNEYSKNQENIKNSASNLKQIVDKEILHQIQNRPDNDHFIKLLNSIGWKSTVINSRIQLQRESETHRFLALTTIKPPLQLSNQQKQLQVEQKRLQLQELRQQLVSQPNAKNRKLFQQISQHNLQAAFEEDIVQVAIFVSKKVNTRQAYLCIEYMANSQMAQMSSFCFYSRIIKSRVDRFQSCREYTTRGINTIDFQIATKFTQYLESELELKAQVVQTIAQLTNCYEQQQYLNWLKDIKNIL